MSMIPTEKAAALIASHWRAGTVFDGLEPAIRPQTRAQGYAVQAHVEGLSKKALYGWKIGATSIAGQQHIGVSGPLLGRILAERVRQSGGEVSLKGNHMRVAECEFAFVFSRDLPPPQGPSLTQAQALAAIASIHPAIEIPDSRFKHFELAGEAQLLADNACAHEFMLGPRATCNWRAMSLAELAVTATVYRAGLPTHHHGVGKNVLGSPLNALLWFVHEAHSLGITIKEGQVVTTGTCVTPISVIPGDDVRVSFGPIGDISIRFTE
jgi:2-keto-4-pentenoate hydratase